MTRRLLHIAAALGVCCALVALINTIGHHPLGATGVMTAMAVVTKYATGYLDPTAKVHIDAVNRAAEVRRINSLISVTNGDSIASKYFVGSVPSNAILSPGGTLWFSAITGFTDCDLGLAYPNGGAMIVADCIVNGHDVHLAGSTTLAAATGSGVATPANMAKRAWELAGLTADPGGELDLVLTANAAASAAGTIWAHLPYDKAA